MLHYFIVIVCWKYIHVHVLCWNHNMFVKSLSIMLHINIQLLHCRYNVIAIKMY